MCPSTSIRKVHVADATTTSTATAANSKKFETKIDKYCGGPLTLELNRPTNTNWGITVRQMFFCETMVKVKRVQRGSPAEAAGLMRDDRIIAIDNVPVEYLLRQVAATLQEKTTVTLTILPSILHRFHGAVMKNNDCATVSLKRCKQIESWGMTLRWNPHIQGLMVVQTLSGFPAHCANIMVGDKILAINSQPVDPATAIDGEPIKLSNPEIEMFVTIQRRAHWANLTPTTRMVVAAPAYSDYHNTNGTLPPCPPSPTTSVVINSPPLSDFTNRPSIDSKQHGYESACQQEPPMTAPTYQQAVNVPPVSAPMYPTSALDHDQQLRQ